MNKETTAAKCVLGSVTLYVYAISETRTKVISHDGKTGEMFAIDFEPTATIVCETEKGPTFATLDPCPHGVPPVNKAMDSVIKSTLWALKSMPSIETVDSQVYLKKRTAEVV